jgi:hypothetical protein
MSRHRTPRLLLLAVALSLAAALVPPIAATAASHVTATRFTGADPFEAAASASAHLFPSGAPAAVLARSDGTGPAAYGAGVAATVGGPLLLTLGDDVPDPTMDELARLGVTGVVLMGGPGVIDGTAEAELAGAGLAVERVPGAVDAAALVADGDAIGTAYLVLDSSPMDQAVAGPAAAANGGVVLEVSAGTLPAAVQLFLDAASVERAVLVGAAAQGADGRALADALEGLGVEAVPLYGRTVPETSVALEESGFRDPGTFVMAHTDSPSDVLIAAGMGAVADAPLLYADDAALPFADFVLGALSAHAANLTDLWIVAAPATIPEARVDDALEAAEPIGIMTLARLEELLDAGETVIGTAWSVIGPNPAIPGATDIDPVPFQVRVTGIQAGIAPGLSMIMVRASGEVIDETAGIVSGMSGSPVYVEDEGTTKLLGAVAFGCEFCNQRIGGLTPAEHMLEVLDYPGPPGSLGLPQKVFARVQGSTVELRNLMVLGIDGLRERRLRKVTDDLRAAGHDFRAVPSFAAQSFGGPVFRPFDPLFPGHSIAGVIAAGSLSFAGIGTTTYREGDRSLGFGHPFFLAGPSNLGLASARIIDVADDVSQTFGGFKMGSVTGAHGVMDQDRFAAIGGTEGTFPHLARLPSRLRNVDTGKEFRFRTDSVMLEFFPDIAAIALLVGLDRTFDRIGGGTVLLRWLIEGRRAGEVPFSVERSQRFANRLDVTFESIFDLLFDLFVIQENPFEEVTFDRVSVHGSLTQEVLQRDIVRVEARSRRSRGFVREGSRLRVAPGDRIRIRVFLKAPRADTIVRRLVIRVPGKARGRGRLIVRGGKGFSDDDFFFFNGFPPGGGGQEGSLDDILAGIAQKPRSDALSARLAGLRGRRAVRVTELTPWVLSGRATFRVVVVRRR